MIVSLTRLFPSIIFMKLKEPIAYLERLYLIWVLSSCRETMLVFNNPRDKQKERFTFEETGGLEANRKMGKVILNYFP